MTNNPNGFHAIILDTETHTLDGLPIQIAFGACDIQNASLIFDKSKIIDQYFSIGDVKISHAAMAVHHIIDTDLADKPDFSKFTLPSDVRYIVGHNIQYDLNAIAKCGVDINILKPICTLALARHIWPDLEAHNLSAMLYFLYSHNQDAARTLLKNAHSASADVILTATVLFKIIQALNVQTLEELHQISEDARIWKKMYFGKHKGDSIESLPVSYVNWLLKQDDLDPYLKQGIFTYHPNFKPSA